jgi:threonylcarbamoyladenosine tRNA methylthiotransferase MtaB
MKIAFETLGCKLNQAETEMMARRFASEGHRLVSPDEEADIYILNTCTVTGTADAKSRHLLRLAHRRNPEAVLVAAGCYAERAADELLKIDGVKMAAGNDDKLSILRLLGEAGYLNVALPEKTAAPDRESGLRTRASIKIQDGCDNFCSYCIVPFVRGREKSLPADTVMDEIGQRISEGAQEIVITGTEIGSYKHGNMLLKDLLERILHETDIARLRISSLQPQEITPELVGLWRDERLCPHFHLSLQSGSDSVLRRMNRRYTTAEYANAVKEIRKVAPEAAITTDVIAGFPGETEEEFEESCDFVRETGFARLHVFSYSPRPGTKAADMPGKVQDTVKAQRNRKLRALGRERADSYARRFTGRRMPVLWEQHSGKTWTGYTPNYIKVYADSEENMANKIIPVTLGKPCKTDGMRGEL